jgi:hypothetical protein
MRKERGGMTLPAAILSSYKTYTRASSAMVAGTAGCGLGVRKEAALLGRYQNQKKIFQALCRLHICLWLGELGCFAKLERKLSSKRAYEIRQ